MTITPDTNVLVRSVVRDHPQQTRLAEDILRSASLIAVTVPCLCELVWVLRRVYGLPSNRIAASIRVLYEADGVEMDRSVVEEGLALLDAGGDFADGVVPVEGARLGGNTFVSFDRKAVRLLTARGHRAQELA